MTAADKYYLKAKENYPYEMEVALEALEYGLSYDDTHAPLLTMKAEIYFNDLRRLYAALECLEAALYHDPYYTEAHYLYMKVLFEIGETEKAAKHLPKALAVKGIDKAKVWHQEALILEHHGLLDEAIEKLAEAKKYSQSKDGFSFYSSEAKRIKKKSKFINHDAEAEEDADDATSSAPAEMAA